MLHGPEGRRTDKPEYLPRRTDRRIFLQLTETLNITEAGFWGCGWIGSRISSSWNPLSEKSLSLLANHWVWRIATCGYRVDGLDDDSAM